MYHLIYDSKIYVYDMMHYENQAASVIPYA